MPDSATNATIGTAMPNTTTIPARSVHGRRTPADPGCLGEARG
jgi:hypothetical protein